MSIFSKPTDGNTNRWGQNIGRAIGTIALGPIGGWLGGRIGGNFGNSSPAQLGPVQQYTPSTGADTTNAQLAQSMQTWAQQQQQARLEQARREAGQAPSAPQPTQSYSHTSPEQQAAAERMALVNAMQAMQQGNDKAWVSAMSQRNREQ